VYTTAINKKQQRGTPHSIIILILFFCEVILLLFSAGVLKGFMFQCDGCAVTLSSVSDGHSFNTSRLNAGKMLKLSIEGLQMGIPSSLKYLSFQSND
jgi:hypothetical protein